MFIFPLTFYGQEISVYPYWSKSDEEKKKINEEKYLKYKLVAFDYVVTEKIRTQLINKKQIFLRSDSMQVIFSPFEYGIRKVISDSINNYGIYRIKFSSSHSQSFLLFKEINDIEILFNYEDYRLETLISQILTFLIKHQEKFTENDKKELFENLCIFMRELE